MKVGTYTRLSAPLLGCALLWTSAACGSRTSLLQEEDAGVVTADDSPQTSSNSVGNRGRAGSGGTTARAGRGGTAGAGGMASRATGGRAGRAGGAGGAGGAGRAGEEGEDGEDPRAGAGGRVSDRDAAADSDDDEQPSMAGTGGEESGGSGGEPADEAGAGGESGAAGGDAAGSGGSDAEPVDAGSEPEGARLTGLTPEQTTELCGRIESATANLQWTEAVRGWCSRGALGTPECPASQEACVAGASIIPVCSQTVPDCPDITVEEFVTCRTDTLLSFVEYNRAITCDTPAGIPGEAEVPSCVGPYQRCAPLAALKR